MASFFDEFQHLKIQLQDIKSATNNFGDKLLIGKGGFGKVYKGEISHSNRRSMAAFKRLDSILGQGNSEFWKEIMMLSRYTHENLVSLLGYCDECGEKILVYEHASRGSLDLHLSSTTLTWMRRLKICLGAARGLSYLHDPKETQQRVLHRDIKSSNILLDEDWNAKVSDLGLSKIGPANQQHTALVSNAVGTFGYLDPLYVDMGLLTKESDVYSFGVVLFEVLCGRVCFGYSNDQYEFLVRKWQQSYELKKLDEIIFQDLKRQVDSSSLETFSDIAYQCLKRSREERPTMAHVVGKLEMALESQEIYEGGELSKDSVDIITAAVPALTYGSKAELKSILSKGILVNRGKTWFSINENREHIEMISAAEFLNPLGSGSLVYAFSPEENSRFAGGSYIAYEGIFKAHVKARFLSPRIPYTVNLVFQFIRGKPTKRMLVFLAYKYEFEGETKSSISCHADWREDGWMTIELCQFTSDNNTFDLEIQLEGTKYHKTLLVEGIEFRPLEKGEQEAPNDKKVDMHSISDSDIDWEQKLPKDYEEIIKWSKDSLEWTTKKELYFIFCKGFLINNGAEWFSLAKNGKKCHMLRARNALRGYEWKWKSLPESRFEEVAFDADTGLFRIVSEIKSQKLSPQTTYACYLVYNITKNHSRFEAPMTVMDYDTREDIGYIYLLGPQTPLIRSKLDQNTHNRSSRPKMKGFPQVRKDGWMEVQVWELQAVTTIEKIQIKFLLSYTSFEGLIVQGIEFKPM